MRLERRFLAVACVACPFRTDEVLALPRGRREEIADSLRHGDPFHCHKTVSYTEDGTDVADANVCGGARKAAAGEGIVSTLEQVSERLGIDVAPIVDGPPVYPTLQAWIDAAPKGR